MDFAPDSGVTSMVCAHLSGVTVCMRNELLLPGLIQILLGLRWDYLATWLCVFIDDNLMKLPVSGFARRGGGSVRRNFCTPKPVSAPGGTMAIEYKSNLNYRNQYHCISSREFNRITSCQSSLSQQKMAAKFVVSACESNICDLWCLLTQCFFNNLCLAPVGRGDVRPRCICTSPKA